MGDSSRQRTGRAAPVVAGLSSLVLTAALSGPWGLAVFVLTGLVMVLTALKISGSLGGLTGDVYGALLETGDLAAYLSFLVLLRFEIPLTSGLLLLV